MSTASAAAHGIAHTFLNVVDGRSTAALGGATLDVLGPSDGAVITTMPRSGAEDIDRAVAAARKAIEEGPWGRMTATERGRLLC